MFLIITALTGGFFEKEGGLVALGALEGRLVYFFAKYNQTFTFRLFHPADRKNICAGNCFVHVLAEDNLWTLKLQQI